MKEIKELSEHIDTELKDAEEYILEALKYKGIDKNLADMYYKMSEDEARHYNMLHIQGVRLIKLYMEKGEKIPSSMQAVYDYLHAKHIESTNRIKMYQEQYNS